MRQYPSGKSDLARWPFGVNVMDDLATMDQRYAQKLDNMEYRNGTVVRRKPFTAKSTELLPADASFGMEYVDTAGTFRILWGSMDGKVKEFVSASSHADRVTGLTASKRAFMAQMLGAAFHQNGEDSPRRGDGTTWRAAGAPTPPGTLSLGAQSAGALTGNYKAMVTACIRESGVVVLESDWSNIVEFTVAAERQVINWVASADARVNWYRVYRVLEGQGTPYFLEGEGNVLTFEVNTTDAALSEQESPPLGRNGPMPIASMVVQAGGRLACVKLKDASDPNAGKAVHVSIVATNRHEMEYFPDDETHRFYLPGPGDATAAFGYSVKDEDQAANDLFLAQKTACYILRGTNPYGTLEPISYTKGVVGERAVTQWGRFLFFVSNEGLEFLGPEGEPILISPHVNAFFFGGGPLNIAANVGPEYIRLEIDGGRLLITLRDDSGHAWGNKALVLDLERFNAYNPKPDRNAFYVQWYLVGGGMAFFLPLRDGDLLLFDNRNRRILQQASSGYQDTVNAVATLIRGLIWTSGMMAESMGFLKVLRQINVLQQSEADTTIDIEADYGYKDVRNKTIPRFITARSWDKVWDKVWGAASVFLSSLFLPRDLKGRFFQAKIKVENASSTYTFLGITSFFSAIKARRLTQR
jgi:hypothetical protein